MKRAKVDLVAIRGHIQHGMMGPTAEHLGIHINNLSMKLRGKRPLRIEEINGIAEFLGVGADRFILFEEGNPDQAETTGD